ncbi:MAG: hypothetical protein ACNI3C_06720 [Candidatus Marinarcus sp.]|uniref:hypothetical protein n=1 Tax=Candidatus Marinarcus sp. TaxID=3100987 RepID=UPI003B00FA74
MNKIFFFVITIIILLAGCTAKKYPSFSKNKNDWKGGYINTLSQYKRVNNNDDFTNISKDTDNSKANKSKKDFSNMDVNNQNIDSYGW